MLSTLLLSLGAGRAQEQFALTAHHFGGGLDMRYDWSARLVGSQVTVERIGFRSQRVRQISRSQLNTLRRSIDANNFFDLHSRYGCFQCSDNPACTLIVILGGKTKQVQVHQYFQDALPDSGPETGDVRRFMSVWRLVKRIAGFSRVKDLCP